MRFTEHEEPQGYITFEHEDICIHEFTCDNLIVNYNVSLFSIITYDIKFSVKCTDESCMSVFARWFADKCLLHPTKNINSNARLRLAYKDGKVLHCEIKGLFPTCVDAYSNTVNFSAKYISEVDHA